MGWERTARGLTALGAIVLGVAMLVGGPAGWSGLPLGLRLFASAWLPGALVCFALARRAGRHDAFEILAAPAAPALHFVVSLVFVLAATLPPFLIGSSLATAHHLLGAGLVGAGLAGAWSLGDTRVWLAGAQRIGGGVPALLAACAVLLPVVLGHAGATVDDWWDLAFVGAWERAEALDFAEPVLGTGRTHPRFGYSVWLSLQALILYGDYARAVDFQSRELAAFACIAVVCAQAFFAQALFGRARGRLVVATVLMVPVWLYTTEALPFFTRLYQDKFVAGLVLLPVVLGLAAAFDARGGRVRGALLAAALVALVATHALIFAVTAVGLVLLGGASFAVGFDRRLWRRRWAFVALLLAAGFVEPARQAFEVGGWFEAQGIAIENVDNPVVLAHMSLERLIAPTSALRVVHPGAVFGVTGLLLIPAFVLLVRSRDGADLRLAALVAGPALVIFTPFVAGLVGQLIVPWMLYRIGWIVPVPAALAVVALAVVGAGPRRVGVRYAALALLAAYTAVVAGDRLHRGMREHPTVREAGPRGTSLALYRAVDDLPADALVMAPLGVSRLIPALGRRATVAMSERATLVFAGEAQAAYRRLADRAEFFASDTSPAERVAIARRWGATHAVFRKHFVTAGSESRWLGGGGVAGLRAVLDRERGATFTPTAARALAASGRGAKVVFDNRDFVLVALGPAAPVGDAGGNASDARHAWDASRWNAGLGIEPNDGDGVPVASDRIIAAAVRYPRGRVQLDPEPVSRGAFDSLVWARGGQLWEDAPSEVRIVIGTAVRCGVEAVEIVPFIPSGRRAVFDVSVAGRTVRRRARDRRAMRIDLPDAERSELRGGVRVRIRSVFGRPFGLDDVRLVGDRKGCAKSWRPVVEDPRKMSMLPGIDLVRAYPGRAHAARALALELDASGRSADALAMLRGATIAEPEVSVTWIERGLLTDRLEGMESALDAYDEGLRRDSRSAWAHGCAAWADYRSGNPFGTAAHAARAATLDDDYADARVLLALVAESAGLSGVAERFARRAIELDRYRSWGYLALADLRVNAGDRAGALEVLDRFLALDASDADVQAKRAYVAAQGGG